MIVDRDGIGEIARMVCNRVVDDGLSCVLLRGELGSGKTFFAKKLISSLGVDENLICSPTFDIVREYNVDYFGDIVHCDLYRMQNIDELDDVGFFDCLDKARLMIVEWPDLCLEYVKNYTASIQINYVDDIDFRDVLVRYEIYP